MPTRLKYTDDDIDEDMKLTRGDYLKILHHYQPRDRDSITNNTSIKSRAHRILAGKLCRCIKARNDSTSEKRSIAYCSQSIFNNRGMRQHGFRCKTKRGRLHPKLTRDITKTVRRLRMG